MSLEYASEKFSNAAHVLATHRGEIKERLVAALTGGISSLRAEPDIPEDLRAEYRRFWERVNAAPPIAGVGSLAASVREMSEDEAIEVANLILRFADEFQVRLEEKLNSPQG